MPDAEIWVPKEGEPIPPVDPGHLKLRWNIKPPFDDEAAIAAEVKKLDSSALLRRYSMIRILAAYKDELLAPWHHDSELHDAVFRIAATFPMRELRHRAQPIAGDEIFGFDPNAFVQRLIEENWRPAQLGADSNQIP